MITTNGDLSARLFVWPVNFTSLHFSSAHFAHQLWLPITVCTHMLIVGRLGRRLALGISKLTSPLRAHLEATPSGTNEPQIGRSP